MAITIIFGKPRVGKTAYMTWLARGVMFDRERWLNMVRAIEPLSRSRIERGLKPYTLPRHCVYANYDIVGRKQGYTPRKSMRINPFRLGYQDDTNKHIKLHVLPSYALLVITEGQKYFNSRKSLKYPDWQSRYYEQHGHDDLDVLIDVQRPALIDVNIRELSRFTEIVKKTDHINKYGKQYQKWTVRHFEDCFALDRYLASAKKDTTTYTEEVVSSDRNVHEMYNSKMCRPKHFAHKLFNDFEVKEHEPLEETIQGMLKHLEEVDDELPTGFYGVDKRSAA